MTFRAASFCTAADCGSRPRKLTYTAPCGTRSASWTPSVGCAIGSRTFHHHLGGGIEIARFSRDRGAGLRNSSRPDRRRRAQRRSRRATWKPDFTSLATVSGTRLTRVSPGVISRGMTRRMGVFLGVERRPSAMGWCGRRICSKCAARLNAPSGEHVFIGARCVAHLSPRRQMAARFRCQPVMGRAALSCRPHQAGIASGTITSGSPRDRYYELLRRRSPSCSAYSVLGAVDGRRRRGSARLLPVLDAPFWGWIGVVFFGGCMVIMVTRLFMRGPIVVLDHVGILDRRVSPDVILWSDIRCVRIVTYRKQLMAGRGDEGPCFLQVPAPEGRPLAGAGQRAPGLHGVQRGLQRNLSRHGRGLELRPATPPRKWADGACSARRTRTAPDRLAPLTRIARSFRRIFPRPRATG